MADDTKTQKEASDTESQDKDSAKLPTPAEKHKNYEADRKRLAEEHSNA